jgi:molybdopterin-guanine dinucleotide biosynthesis protein A
MGRNKGLLPVAGVPMLLLAQRLLEERVSPLAICGDADGAYAHLGLPVLPDRVADHGPLAGLRSALAWSPHDHCLVLPCDLPHLDGRILDLLLARRGLHDAIVALSPGGAEPLVAIYHRRCLGAIEAALQADRRALQQLLRQVETVLVDVAAELPAVDAARAFANINRAEDLPPGIEPSG